MRTTAGVLLTIALTAVTVAAKGPTLKITVAGPGLAQPITITSANALKPNIWGGDFYVAPASPPEASLPRYVVSFYAAAVPPATGPELRYVVTFVRDPRSGVAFLYFPGAGEDGYRLNRGTIIRGIEGTWREADKAWSDAIAAALRGQVGKLVSW